MDKKIVYEQRVVEGVDERKATKKQRKMSVEGESLLWKKLNK